MVCGLNDNFKWFHFPGKVEQMGAEKKDELHTFEFVRNSVSGEKNTFANPFFICSDNEPKMRAAFDRRFDDPTGFSLDGRIGCGEHELSICIDHVFENHPNDELKQFLNKMSIIETFYNKRQGFAKELPISIPEEFTTCQWRINYPHYQNFHELDILENLPSLHVC